jgi:hypothetical protein
MMTDTTKPFPIVLDLTSTDAFYVLTTALEEFATTAEFGAEESEKSAKYNGVEPDRLAETMRPTRRPA